MDQILIAPASTSLSSDSRTIFAGQARLMAERAQRDLPITSGSLKRLARLGEQLDAIKEHARDVSR